MGQQVVKTKIWTPGTDYSIKEQGWPTVQFSRCKRPWTWHMVVQKAFEESHWPSFIKWRLLSFFSITCIMSQSTQPNMWILLWIKIDRMLEYEVEQRLMKEAQCSQCKHFWNMVRFLSGQSNWSESHREVWKLSSKQGCEKEREVIFVVLFWCTLSLFSMHFTLKE